MSVEGRSCLDANILVYSVDLDAGERYERAKRIIALALHSDCVVPLQALAEFFLVTTRRKLLEPERARVLVRDWTNAFRIYWADTATLFDAIAAVKEHNISFWDAMIWAVARQTGCSALITEDMQDKRVLDGVAFLNPFAADADERLAAFGLHVGRPPTRRSEG